MFDQLVRVERLAGPVSDQIDAGIAFVARFMQPSPARGSSMETVLARDLDVVDEAIVNAVAHRDYAIAGSKIRFFFADRLELYSPGKPPNTITLDDMPYRTFTRDQLLVSFRMRFRKQARGTSVFWSPAARACGIFWRTARRPQAADQSTSCSVTSFG